MGIAMLKLNRTVANYLGDLDRTDINFKTIAMYKQQIENHIQDLDKSKSKAILIDDDDFRNTVRELYICLRSMIRKVGTLRNYFLRNKLVDENYINEKIDHLCRTIQEVENPSVSQKLNACADQAYSLIFR